MIERLENKNIFTSKIAFARAILAIAALITVLCNDIGRITDTRLLVTDSNSVQTLSLFHACSIFTLFSPLVSKLVCTAILGFAISGYYPRISVLLQAWVHLSICNSFIIGEGGDQIASNLCLLLIPICLFDKRKNQWRDETLQSAPSKTKNLIFSTYYFLIQIQVAVIYFHAATGKLQSAEWLDGTCMYYWFSSNFFGVSPVFKGLVNFLTLSSFSPILPWSVILLELGLFACLFATDKKIKLFFLVSGLIFHFFIILIFGLVSFFMATAAGLILYLDQDNVAYSYFKKFITRIYGFRIQVPLLALRQGVNYIAQYRRRRLSLLPDKPADTVS